MKRFRRISALLFGLVAPLLLLSVASNSKHAKRENRYFAYVGTYTAKTSSKGIYAYRFDPETGKLDSIGVAAETTDPSFLAVHPSGKFLYAVNEVSEFEGEKSGAVSAFSIDRETGKLALLNQVSSRGAGPCHISLDKTGKYVFVANYDGGSVAAFPVLDDRRLGKASAFVQHHGSSVNKERQEGPHAHYIQVSEDNRYAFVVDLGLDEVLAYRFDGRTGALTPNDPPFVKIKPGSGPRHLVFSPDRKFVYVVNELGSTVTALSYRAERGAFREIGTVSTLPRDFSGENDTAEIAVDPTGKFLYASNRGHDSIAGFALDSAKGTLTPTAHVSTGGKTPRNFAIDPTGEYLLAANQNSDSIIVFRIDPKTGGLTATGQEVRVPAPVCIVFVAAD